ncbi:MAG TPA: hypothetical protein P5116_01605 [Eubacteriales bacterium]|nr:hypothetical protein [Clostridia bacterium]HRV72557.1 hypothetical protein [Eubacteriales bacterium]
MEEYSKEGAKSYIAACFLKQGDFGILPKGVFNEMLDKVMELDEEFMVKSGVNDGAFYDDDDAFDYMFKAMCEAFSEQKMYCMRFIDDYMGYNEDYLDSVGGIDWE